LRALLLLTRCAVAPLQRLVRLWMARASGSADRGGGSGGGGVRHLAAPGALLPAPLESVMWLVARACIAQGDWQVQALRRGSALRFPPLAPPSPCRQSTVLLRTPCDVVDLVQSELWTWQATECCRLRAVTALQAVFTQCTFAGVTA
jgi:hypothetical protein